MRAASPVKGEVESWLNGKQLNYIKIQGTCYPIRETSACLSISLCLSLTPGPSVAIKPSPIDVLSKHSFSLLNTFYWFSLHRTRTHWEREKAFVSVRCLGNLSDKHECHVSRYSSSAHTHSHTEIDVLCTLATRRMSNVSCLLFCLSSMRHTSKLAYDVTWANMGFIPQPIRMPHKSRNNPAKNKF